MSAETRIPRSATGSVDMTSPDMRATPGVSYPTDPISTPKPTQDINYKRTLIQAVATITRKVIPRQFGHWKTLKFSGYFFFLVGGFTFRLGVKNGQPLGATDRLIDELQRTLRNDTLSTDEVEGINQSIRTLKRINGMTVPKAAEKATIPKATSDLKAQLGGALTESFASILADVGMPINNIGVGVVVQFRWAGGPDLVRVTLDVDLDF